jgi:hypothetical protein
VKFNKNAVVLASVVVASSSVISPIAADVVWASCGEPGRLACSMELEPWYLEDLVPSRPITMEPFDSYFFDFNEDTGMFETIVIRYNEDAYDPNSPPDQTIDIVGAFPSGGPTPFAFAGVQYELMASLMGVAGLGRVALTDEGVCITLGVGAGVGATTSIGSVGFAPQEGVGVETRVTTNVGTVSANLVTTLNPDGTYAVGIRAGNGTARTGVDLSSDGTVAPAFGLSPSLGLGAAIYSVNTYTYSISWETLFGLDSGGAAPGGCG